jgi:hypothetical protein
MGILPEEKKTTLGTFLIGSRSGEKKGLGDVTFTTHRNQERSVLFFRAGRPKDVRVTMVPKVGHPARRTRPLLGNNNGSNI